ncbi:hypothetical protein SYNPS1DRAFT_20832 [Syncephalis pseudoplumigaleata]|uniref:Uncharacterized protein n=1 Tax=Syncephalis pseudoplumigaleata TaxID=1712513 RepID=A0A4P9Z6E5_9FUNG|nr:hypothetical protein SYNPS1DRAFT_20832 [Syncephalis pseudoplumigaleata]|eukprot:RKP27722.1 hypothetical protein SYNPS1DRAFT_20832 [Syncephalis pseudoplumigaleata]
MFLKHILRQLAEKHITEKLLESPAFHRMAARTHEKVEELTEKGGEIAQQLKETEAAKRASDFGEAFKEHLDREIKKLK